MSYRNAALLALLLIGMQSGSAQTAEKKYRGKTAQEWLAIHLDMESNLRFEADDALEAFGAEGAQLAVEAFKKAVTETPADDMPSYFSSGAITISGKLDPVEEYANLVIALGKLLPPEQLRGLVAFGQSGKLADTDFVEELYDNIPAVPAHVDYWVSVITTEGPKWEDEAGEKLETLAGQDPKLVPAIIAGLEKNLSHPQAEFRLSALNVLAKLLLDNPELVKTIQPLQKDPDLAVAKQAKTILADFEEGKKYAEQDDASGIGALLALGSNLAQLHALKGNEKRIRANLKVGRLDAVLEELALIFQIAPDAEIPTKMVKLIWEKRKNRKENQTEYDIAQEILQQFDQWAAPKTNDNTEPQKK